MIRAKGKAKKDKEKVRIGIGGEAVEAQSGGRRQTPGEIRIQSDIASLDAGRIAEAKFPNPQDLTNFLVTVSPDEGFWKGATYEFSLSIPPTYPHDPPKVHCNTKIFHPNINLEGGVCLNILREDWRPVLDVNAVIYGLIQLFGHDVNSEDPLNREAAALLQTDRAQFERVVRRTLQGYSHGGESFPRLI